MCCLCVQVYDSDQDHRAEMTRLQDQLAVLQAEAAKHETVLNTAVSANREKVNKLQEDKAMLEVYLFDHANLFYFDV